MPFKYMLFVLMTGLATNIHAAPEPLPLDLIELLGEMDDNDNALEQAMTEIEQQAPKSARQTTPDKPQPSAAGGNKQ